MIKTLVVSYTPRVDSNTLKLVKDFIKRSERKTEISYLDLVVNTPDLLLKDNLNVMLKRNFTDEVLSEEETASLAKNDEMLFQLKASDFIVLAYPMNNFTVPAPVKAWIDAVLQPNQTFKLTEKGYEGLCHGKKAAVLMTTGGDYNLEIMKSLNHVTGFITTVFNIIGIPLQHISAYGLNVYPNRIDEILEITKEKISDLVKQWYD